MFIEWRRICGVKILDILVKNKYRYARVNKDHVIKVPKNISVEDAAGIPEVWLTAYLNLRILGNLTKNENVMIYAGASGVGTAAIQMVKWFGGNSYFTCSTKEKIDFCKKY